MRQSHENIQSDFGLAARNPIPYVRADWFVDTASRPSLYHQLLDLPDTAKELEKRLGVDVKKNIDSGRIARAGFSESVPSVNNRVVERHSSNNGAYWFSYDFKKSSGLSNIFRRPLSPGTDADLKDFVFQHAGGEVVFNLSNGMQGYLIVDKDGKRIDEAPVDVVRDPTEISGTPIVVNGVSCMGCHDRGIKTFSDAVLKGFRGGEDKAVRMVQRLYAAKPVMDRLIQGDIDRFRNAMLRAAGPFMLTDGDQGRDILSFDEPINQLVRRYNQDLTAQEVSMELGREDPSVLKVLISNTDSLLDLGLGPLADNRTIKREVWDSKDEGDSMFQQAALKLRMGNPLNN